MGGVPGGSGCVFDEIRWKKKSIMISEKRAVFEFQFFSKILIKILKNVFPKGAGPVTPGLDFLLSKLAETLPKKLRN